MDQVSPWRMCPGSNDVHPIGWAASSSELSTDSDCDPPRNWCTLTIIWKINSIWRQFFVRNEWLTLVTWQAADGADEEQGEQRRLELIIHDSQQLSGPMSADCRWFFVGLHLTVDGFLMASDGFVTSLFIAAQGSSTPSLGQLSRLPHAPPLLSSQTQIAQCVPLEQRDANSTGNMKIWQLNQSLQLVR